MLQSMPHSEEVTSNQPMEDMQQVLTLATLTQDLMLATLVGTEEVMEGDTGPTLLQFNTEEVTLPTDTDIDHKIISTIQWFDL